MNASDGVTVTDAVTAVAVTDAVSTVDDRVSLPFIVCIIYGKGMCTNAICDM